MISMSDFIEQNSITVTSEWRERTTEKVRHAYGPTSFYERDHYDVTITLGDESVSFVYMQGEAVDGEPADRPDDVVDSFIRDAFRYYNNCADPDAPTTHDFVTFVQEFGGADDLVQAATAWEGCKETYGQALKMFSSQLLNYAWFQVEPL